MLPRAFHFNGKTLAALKHEPVNVAPMANMIKTTHTSDDSEDDGFDSSDTVVWAWVKLAEKKKKKNVLLQHWAGQRFVGNIVA